MSCARHIRMMWCDYMHRNVQDVPIHCHGDELTNVHDMMRSKSYIRTHRISTSTPLHAPCSYKNCAATASLLLGIFFGLILQIFLSFLESVSLILQWKAAVWACILEARLEEERRRLAEEEVGQASECGLAIGSQWPLQIGPKWRIVWIGDWCQVNRIWLFSVSSSWILIVFGRLATLTHILRDLRV